MLLAAEFWDFKTEMLHIKNQILLESTYQDMILEAMKIFECDTKDNIDANMAQKTSSISSNTHNNNHLDKYRSLTEKQQQRLAKIQRTVKEITRS